MMLKTKVVAIVAWSVASAALADEAPIDRPLSFGRHEEVGAHVLPGGAGVLRVRFVSGQTDAVVRLKPAEGTWNLDQAAMVLVDVRNRGTKPAALIGRFADSKWTSSLVVVPPGATETLWLYADHPLTGRFDGENYQIGFVDTCDTPYPETITASRDMGQMLYPSAPSGK